MVKGWVYNSILFGPLVRYVGYIYVGDDPMEDLKTIQSRIDEGYSIAIFPEGSRSQTDWWQICRRLAAGGGSAGGGGIDFGIRRSADPLHHLWMFMQ